MKRILVPVVLAVLFITSPNAHAAIAPPAISSSVGTVGKETIVSAQTETTISLKENLEIKSALVKSGKRSFFQKIKRFFLPEAGKSKNTAALLSFFFGSLGIHRFYLGYDTIGIILALLTLLGIALFVVGVPATVLTVSGSIAKVSGALVAAWLILLSVATWNLVDFVRILTGSLKPKNGDYTK